MAANPSCLLDSNTLLRISTGDDSSHPVIAKAIRELIRQGITLCYNSQTLAEFLERLHKANRQKRLRTKRCRHGSLGSGNGAAI